jgi:predicted nuclease with TOPRIM domain
VFLHRYHRCYTLERENEVRKQELANQISENAALREVREASNGRENSLNKTIERLDIEKSAVETQAQALQDEIRGVTEERKQVIDRCETKLHGNSWCDTFQP